VIAVDLDGGSEVMLHVGSFPCCADWLPDGRLVVVSTRDGQLLRQEPDGSLVTHADLATASSPPAGNELVVDACGNAYVNGGGFNLAAGEPFAPGIIALATPDGSAHQVADRLAFPNGMLITEDGETLIVAESYAKRLTAFDVEADGSLSNRRVWADLGDGVPEGSASTPKVRSGTATSPTSAASACTKAARCCRRSSSTAAASPAPSAARNGGRFSWWRPSGKAQRRSSPSRGPASCSPSRLGRPVSAGRNERKG
jgi:SMP-30/Gluconolactonase/LRE-like region